MRDIAAPLPQNKSVQARSTTCQTEQLQLKQTSGLPMFGASAITSDTVQFSGLFKTKTAQELLSLKSGETWTYQPNTKAGYRISNGRAPEITGIQRLPEYLVLGVGEAETQSVRVNREPLEPGEFRILKAGDEFQIGKFKRKIPKLLQIQTTQSIPAFSPEAKAQSIDYDIHNTLPQEQPLLDGFRVGFNWDDETGLPVAYPAFHGVSIVDRSRDAKLRGWLEEAKALQALPAMKERWDGLEKIALRILESEPRPPLSPMFYLAEQLEQLKNPRNLTILMKMLADEAGLPVALCQGTYHNGEYQDHRSWLVLNREDGKQVILDPQVVAARHNLQRQVADKSASITKDALKGRFESLKKAILEKTAQPSGSQTLDTLEIARRIEEFNRHIVETEKRAPTLDEINEKRAAIMAEIMKQKDDKAAEQATVGIQEYKRTVQQDIKTLKTILETASQDIVLGESQEAACYTLDFDKDEGL